MKLRLENLGRIKKAEIDIRPLTVFIGKNGTNKTWAAYALYGLVRQLTWAPYPHVARLDSETEAKLAAMAREIASSARSTKGGSFVVERAAVDSTDERRRQIELSASVFEGTLNVPDGHLGGVRAHLEFGTEINFADSVEFQFDPDGALVGRQFRQGGQLVARRGYALAGEDFTKRHVQDSLQLLALPHPTTLFALPATRRLLAALPRDVARGPWLTQIEADFLGWRAPTTQSSELGKHIGQLLEGDLTSDGDQTLFEPRGSRIRLPLHATASLVGSLAGLVGYVDVSRPGDFLIIDEPEMNAHPEAILGIAEVLAILANAGVNVVVTTHSPYFVDHLENLMDAAALPAKKQALAKERMQLKDERAFLKPEQLGVYLFEEHGAHVEVKDVLDRKVRGIDWRTFSKVSDRVQNLKVDLAELKGRKSG